MKYDFPPTLTEFAQDMDLEIHWDYDGPDEDAWKGEGKEPTPMVALWSQHEPSVGIFGGAMTPYFESESELEAFCRNVADGVIREGELATYMQEVAE